MIEALSLWSLGALFGLRHAFEPDHLAAVSTLIAGRPGSPAAIALGAAWGLGHTVALVVVASVLGAARATLSPTLAAGFELGVGVMLIGLGVQSLRRALASDTTVERDAGARAADTAGLVAARPSSHQSARWVFARRSLLVGVIHGLAGSGAITALIAAQFPSVAGRVAYVGLFGVGSMIGMATLSGLAGVPLGRASRRPVMRRAIRVAAGAVAITLGIVWASREIVWLAR